MAKRWRERIDDFGRALARLVEAIAESQNSESTTLKDGVIQRFEFTFELAWKALKDYLQYEGLTEVKSPRSVIREGFANEILENGEIWIDMLEDRNLTSHLYQQSIAENIYQKIVTVYLSELRELYQLLSEKEF